MGFRNSDFREHLVRIPQEHGKIGQLASRVSRLLKLLHVRQLIVNIFRSHRWRVTQKSSCHPFINYHLK